MYAIWLFVQPFGWLTTKLSTDDNATPSDWRQCYPFWLLRQPTRLLIMTVCNPHPRPHLAIGWRKTMWQLRYAFWMSRQRPRLFWLFVPPSPPHTLGWRKCYAFWMFRQCPRLPDNATHSDCSHNALCWLGNTTPSSFPNNTSDWQITVYTTPPRPF